MSRVDAEGVDLLSEAMKDGKNKRWKSEVYADSWRAVNLWMESRLCKIKGAGIPTMGCFSWELRSEGECIPVFELSVCVIKNYHVKGHAYKGISLATVEDINYSNVALKHSQNLTKDMIYACVRHLICVMEQFFTRNEDFSLRFTFGKLTHAKRRVKFEFDLNRLMEILPQNIRPFGKPEIPQPTITTLHPDPVTLQPEPAPHDHLASHNNAPVAHVVKVLLEIPELEQIQPNSIVSSEAKPEALREMSVAENMIISRKKAHDAALAVWLSELQRQSQSDTVHSEWRSLPDKLYDNQEALLQSQRANLAEIKAQLDEQALQSVAKKAQERVAKEAVVNTSITLDCELEMDNPVKRDSRAELQPLLERDIAQRKEMALEQKRERVALECSMAKMDIETHRLEMELTRAMKMEKRESVRESQREGQQMVLVKALSQAASASTLSEYVHTHFPDIVTRPSTTSVIGGFRGMGVGFDARLRPRK